MFGCFFNLHFVFVCEKHISFLNAVAFRFAVIIYCLYSCNFLSFRLLSYSAAKIVVFCRKPCTYFANY